VRKHILVLGCLSLIIHNQLSAGCCVSKKKRKKDNTNWTVEKTLLWLGVATAFRCGTPYVLPSSNSPSKKNDGSTG